MFVPCSIKNAVAHMMHQMHLHKVIQTFFFVEIWGSSSQDFFEDLQGHPGQTYPSGPDPLWTPLPGPDLDLIWTRKG